MERIATGPVVAASPPPRGMPLPDGTAAVPAPALADLLDGMPRQRHATVPALDPDPVPVPVPVPVLVSVPASAAASASVFVEARPAVRIPRLWRLLPTPVGTPFTFAYMAVLAVTSVVAAVADPGLVHALYQDSSTDVAHLARTPVLVLLMSALWIAGGVLSPYALAFVLVLTALERRIGGARTACVFLAGHVLATLATEVPVGLAVLFGDLPATSLHRLDYGISFGVATSIGSLAGLLRPWLRWPVLALTAGLLLNDLIAFLDPMTNWGHLIALAIGVSTWPLVRRWQQQA
ncbi:rhomboid-like protein [Streptomyces sp. NPDC052101]|uniref:rhomboid-like protein n=1 Tax=Streptomyces sp. NPDC052101 TaxID=3155763 RepID=UPI003431A429